MTWEEKYVVDRRGCHVWQRAKQTRGYGVVWFDGKARLAHRVAWFMKHGAWPTAGFVVDHICENKACVNPDHLRELTNGANIRRAYPRGSAEVEAKRAMWRKSQSARRSRQSAGRG